MAVCLRRLGGGLDCENAIVCCQMRAMEKGSGVDVGKGLKKVIKHIELHHGEANKYVCGKKVKQNYHKNTTYHYSDNAVAEDRQHHARADC